MDNLYESVKRLIALIRANGSKVAILRTIGEVLVNLANLLESLDIALDAELPASVPSTKKDCVVWLESYVEQDQAQGLSPLMILVLRKLLMILLDELLG